MMIRHNNLDTGCSGCSHAFNTGNTIIDRDNQVRPVLFRNGNDLGRQAVTKSETVWYQIIHLRSAHCPQTTDCQRGAGGAVSIEIADNQNA